MLPIFLSATGDDVEYSHMSKQLADRIKGLLTYITLLFKILTKRRPTMFLILIWNFSRF